MTASRLRRAAIRAAVAVGLVERRRPRCSEHGEPARHVLEPAGDPECLRCKRARTTPGGGYVRDLRFDDFDNRPEIDGRDTVFVAVLVVAGLLDTAMTLSHWHLEANPVVVAAGPAAWVAVKAVSFAAMATAWWGRSARDSAVARAAVWALLLFYSAAVGLNLAVVMAA